MTNKHFRLHHVGRLTILALLPVVMVATPAQAQTVRDWIQLNDGDFDNNFNWSVLNAPDTIGESARFNSGNSHIVALTSGVTRQISDLLVDSGDITFYANGLTPATLDIDDDALITGGNLSLIQGPALDNVSLIVGDLLQVTNGGTLDVLMGSGLTASQIKVGTDPVNSVLNIESGAQVASPISFIGDVLNSIGTATVTGVGSTWDAGGLAVGRSGQGTLNIEAGAQVSSSSGAIGSSSGSSGDATVTGPGSTWTVSQPSNFWVGLIGDGTLDILDGGQLVTSGQSFIAVGNSTTGTAVVAQAGSTWSGEELYVGAPGGSGQGSLTITQGGLVTMTDNFGITPQSSVTLHSNGRLEFGTINAASYARIGGSSGELAGDYLLSGFNALADIDLSITDIDTSEVRIRNSGEIYGGGIVSQALANTAAGELRTFSGEWARFNGVGNTNAGEINNFAGVVEFVQGITNEATGFVGGRGQFIAGGGWTNDGVFAFSGGFADVLGDVTNSATGQITVGGTGTTTFFDDVTMDPVHLNINVASGSTAVFLGSYNGGNDGAGAVDILGDLRPGNSPAEVTYGGNLNFGGLANLLIEIGGLIPGTEHDVLDIVGSLTAGGTLDVSLINAFTPNVGDVFDILDWGSLTGSFNAINLPALASGLEWDTSNLLADGTLSVGLTGDLDGDGFVGINDLNIVLANWNQNVPPANPLADPSGDGFVGIDDLNAVLGNWNAGTPPSLPGANIPEPASLGLMLCGFTALLGRKRPVR